MNQPSPQDLDEARLTAYALDELAGDERAQVERLLEAGTPQAAVAARELAIIREVGTQLTRELARELGAGPVLTPAQRAAISRAANPAQPRPILRWSLAAACAALAAAVMVVVLVPGGAPATQEVAVLAPGHPPRDAANKAGRGFAAAAPTAAAPTPLPSEAAKQAAMLRAPIVDQPEQRGVNDALAKKGDAAVVADEKARKRVGEADAFAAGPLAAPAAPVPPTANAAPGGTRSPSAKAGGQSEHALADAGPAPAPPAAPAVAASAQLAAAPGAGRMQPARPLAMKSQQQAAAGAPGAGPVAADAAASAAEPAPTVADRLQYVQNGAAVVKEEQKSADKAAAAPAAAASAAPAGEVGSASGTGADGMMSTSLASTVQVPLRTRTQSIDSLRRCLDAGRLPPPALVQIGDLINAAPVVQRPAPSGEPAAIGISVGGCPWQPDRQLLSIVIAARRAVPAPRPPLNLVLLVDGSAAMRGDDRLPLIKAGLASLAQRLGAADRMSLVTYGTQARLVIAGAGADDVATALALIAGLSSSADAGGADSAGGLALALEALHRSHHAGSSDEVVLCTAGAPSGDQALADQLRRLAADGVGLQLMAVGHDHPEDGALERLAALGHGSVTYLATAAQAVAALGAISSPPEAVAQHALAEIAFNPAEIASYRLLGAPPMSLRQPADGAGSGELCAGQTVTLLFECARVPQLAGRRLRQEGKDGAADPVLVSVQLAYRRADGQAGVPITSRLGVAEADGQDRIQLALVAAAELGLALRHPDDRRFRWDRMLADAQADPFSAQVDPLRSAQLIDLITRAAALAAKADGR